MSNPFTLEPAHRSDFFEAGDKTALVCLDVHEVQRQALEQLDQLGYKIHTGLFLDDSLLKLNSHPYDVVLFSENFSGQSLKSHGLLQEAANHPAAVRRRQVYVMVGPRFTTGDEFQAFAHSVDLVVAYSDLHSLRPVLRRAVTRQTEAYATFFEAQGAANTPA